jgi:hypothetical protein
MDMRKPSFRHAQPWTGDLILRSRFHQHDKRTQKSVTSFITPLAKWNLYYYPVELSHDFLKKHIHYRQYTRKKSEYATIHPLNYIQ